MENSVEALKMAGNILIFVVAITITISCFTSAIQSLNAIFDMQTADEFVTDADGNYLNFVNFDGGTREVTIETIIPSMYRAYKENYAIYFYKSNGTPLVIYETEKGKDTVGINYIDLEKEVYTNSEAAIAGLQELLYTDKCKKDSKGLYNYLQGKSFIEKQGEYYTDDITGGENTAEVNKTKKRIITYTLN